MSQLTIPLKVAEVADWCEALARRVRAGDTLALSIVEVPCGPSVSPAIAPLRLRIQRGTDLVTACTSAIDGHRSSDPSPGSRALREALGVIRVCSLGSPHTAHTLDRVAGHLRIRVALTAEVRSHTASARLSARLLTALPIVAVGLTVMISQDSARVFTTPAGLLCLSVSLGLNAVGWLWIRSLITAAES